VHRLHQRLRPSRTSSTVIKVIKRWSSGSSSVGFSLRGLDYLRVKFKPRRLKPTLLEPVVPGALSVPFVSLAIALDCQTGANRRQYRHG
jgi:hypothetical protein